MLSSVCYSQDSDYQETTWPIGKKASLPVKCGRGGGEGVTWVVWLRMNGLVSAPHTPPSTIPAQSKCGGSICVYAPIHTHPLYQTKRDSVPSGYLCPLIPPSSGAGRETLGPPQPYPSTLKGGLGHTLYFLGISCRLIGLT